jgi:hypothetical protein
LRALCPHSKLIKIRRYQLVECVHVVRRESFITSRSVSVREKNRSHRNLVIALHTYTTKMTVAMVIDDDDEYKEEILFEMFEWTFLSLRFCKENNFHVVEIENIKLY